MTTRTLSMTADGLDPPAARRQIALRMLFTGAAAAVFLYGALATGGTAAAYAADDSLAQQVLSFTLPGLRLLSWMLGVTIFGAVMIPALIPIGPHDPVRVEALAFAARLGKKWAALVVLQIVLVILNTTNTSLSDLSIGAVTGSLQVQVLVLQLALVVAMIVISNVLARAQPTSAFWAVALGYLAMLPPIASGHEATSARSPVVLGLLVIHIAAASAWVGGLSAVVWTVRRGMDVLSLSVPRYSTVALISATAITVTGSIDAVVKLGISLDAFLTSGYGQIVLAKVVFTGALAGIGLLHRLRTLPAIEGGSSFAFIRLAVVELILMAAVFGLATALSVTD